MKIKNETLITNSDDEIFKTIILEALVGELEVKTKSGVTGEKINNRIMIPVSIDDNDLDENSVQLYEKKAGEWVIKNKLLDNGNLENGDEIKGDNIFSLIYKDEFKC